VKLIEKIAENGNAHEHRINVHWFNDITSPIQPDSADPGPFGNTHPNNGDNSEFVPNNRGTFSSTSEDISAAVDELKSLTYSRIIHFLPEPEPIELLNGDSTISDKHTDHPQVYLTAERAFETLSSGNNKVLIMITDGETHNGEGCPGETMRSQVEADLQRVLGADIGTCPKDDRTATHVCKRTCPSNTGDIRIGVDPNATNVTADTRGNKCQKSCDLSKCMCGLWKSALFKETHPDIPLSIVAIPNLHWDDAYTGFDQATFEAQMKYMASPDRLFFASGMFEALAGIVEPLTNDLCA